MPEYLSFEEVAQALKCSQAKVRSLVLEDKTLIAKRITPWGQVLESCGPDEHYPYDLGVGCYLDDDGKITADIYELKNGETVLTGTIHAGFLRIELAALYAHIPGRQTSASDEFGQLRDNAEVAQRAPGETVAKRNARWLIQFDKEFLNRAKGAQARTIAAISGAEGVNAATVKKGIQDAAKERKASQTGAIKPAQKNSASDPFRLINTKGKTSP